MGQAITVDYLQNKGIARLWGAPERAIPHRLDRKESMKKWIFTALAVSALVLPAAAFAGKDSLLQTCGTGEVTINGGSATIETGPGEYGGVYSKDGPKKSRLDQVTFKFTTDGD